MANITIREYHPETGALLGNITNLDFGGVASGNHSRVRVIDIAFDNVANVGNLKLGVVSNGGLVINNSPQDIAEDGSSSNGRFGIMTSMEFNSSLATEPLSRHFAGINSSISSDNSNNINIPMRGSNVSYYIYLDIETGSSSISNGNGSYKIFFDFS